MRRPAALLLTLTVLAGASAAAEDYGIPKLTGARVEARVTSEPSGIHGFAYRVINGSAKLRIKLFRIDISSTSDRAVVSSEGLSFVDERFRSLTDLNLSRLKVGEFVPVGVSGSPSDWIPAIGWSKVPYVGWGLAVDGGLGKPGDTIAPLVLTSHGLPGIREATAVPDVYDLSPNVDEEDVDPISVLEAIKAADQKLRTVGPVAPPKDLDLVAFADYIGSLRAEAETLGWVRSGTNVSNLDSVLHQVRGQLESKAFGPARASEAAFIAAVESASCSGFECPPDRALTAEARALLALNMAFLRDHTPAP